MNPFYAGSAGLIAPLALAACMSEMRSSGSALKPADRETITVSVGPCFGFCPVYNVGIQSGAAVLFVGQRHTAVMGKRSRNAGAVAYGALARDLAPFRPSTGSEAVIACTAAVSDTSSFTVTWTDRAGVKTIAEAQGDCPGGPARALVTLLRAVPDRLGVADWTKQTTRPGVSRG